MNAKIFDWWSYLYERYGYQEGIGEKDWSCKLTYTSARIVSCGLMCLWIYVNCAAMSEERSGFMIDSLLSDSRGGPPRDASKHSSGNTGK